MLGNMKGRLKSKYIRNRLTIFQCAKIIKEAMEEKYGGMGFWQV